MPFEHRRKQLRVVAILFEHEVVRDELFSRLRQHNLMAEFNRLAASASHDQFRVRLEDTEHFIIIRNFLIAERATPVA